MFHKSQYDNSFPAKWIRQFYVTVVTLTIIRLSLDLCILGLWKTMFSAVDHRAFSLCFPLYLLWSLFSTISYLKAHLEVPKLQKNWSLSFMSTGWPFFLRAAWKKLAILSPCHGLKDLQETPRDSSGLLRLQLYISILSLPPCICKVMC